MPISRVRSVTLIIITAITPMPPTSSATADSVIITRKKTPRELVERVEDLVLRDQVEVVVIRRVQSPRLAQRDRHRLLRVRHRDARSRLDRDEQRVGLVDRELVVQRAIRNDRRASACPAAGRCSPSGW